MSQRLFRSLDMRIGRELEQAMLQFRLCVDAAMPALRVRELDGQHDPRACNGHIAFGAADANMQRSPKAVALINERQTVAPDESQGTQRRPNRAALG
ncbi:MAG TPA: hypothetical protein VFV10_15620, partial [Gammaproteobacteria bacterium]|nr:hypothetical protein [Gammaproteobacteria bacterium]